MIEVIPLRGTTVNKKNILQTISAKEMDRKDFLKYSGVVLIGLVGLKGIATLLTTAESKISAKPEKITRGYGSGKYGV